MRSRWLVVFRYRVVVLRFGCPRNFDTSDVRTPAPWNREAASGRRTRSWKVSKPGGPPKCADLTLLQVTRFRRTPMCSAINLAAAPGGSEAIGTKRGRRSATGWKSEAAALVAFSPSRRES
jgi:hypothetical protein